MLAKNRSNKFFIFHQSTQKIIQAEELNQRSFSKDKFFQIKSSDTLRYGGGNSKKYLIK